MECLCASIRHLVFAITYLLAIQNLTIRLPFPPTPRLESAPVQLFVIIYGFGAANCTCFTNILAIAAVICVCMCETQSHDRILNRTKTGAHTGTLTAKCAFLEAFGMSRFLWQPLRSPHCEVAGTCCIAISWDLCSKPKGGVLSVHLEAINCARVRACL